MKPILGEIISYITNTVQPQPCTVDQVTQSEGVVVDTYSALLSKLAHLAFSNPEFVLLFRGQRRDYPENEKTVLFPTLYRSPAEGHEYYGHQLSIRYQELQAKERALCNALIEPEHRDRVARSELARWAILQHYEVCPTPLLDVTQSALVACSFATTSTGGENAADRYIYVLGVPQINGTITVSPTQALQVIRLSGVCPPQMLRPYIQEGYLIGNYPSVDTLYEKVRYERHEMDCAQRLIAKFRIRNDPSFWDRGFQAIPAETLCPEETDPLCLNISALKRDQ